MESNRSFTIDAMRVRQPIGDIYVGSIPSHTLTEIAFFDIREFQGERGFHSYLGIQREIDPKRVESIKAYVGQPDATFPTAVLLAIDERCVTLEPAVQNSDVFYRMTISNVTGDIDDPETVLYKHVARVIDGQHRIKGLEGYTGATFDVNVSIFIDADISDQANIFAKVNLAQTKVNRSLAYDLLSLAKHQTPERVCHNLVVALDSSEGSPFFKRIKRLGKITPGRTNETLSQATVVTGLLQYMAKNELQLLDDRERILKGRSLLPLTGVEVRVLVLRPFIVDGNDAALGLLIWNYFAAVAARWPAAWQGNQRGLMLNRSNGFDALMRFFRPAYQLLGKPGSVVAQEDFLRLFSTISMDDQDFNTEAFVPGSSGAAALYRQLMSKSGLVQPA